MIEYKYVIVFSHSNYCLKAAGTEKAIRDLQEILILRNIHTLQVFSFNNTLSLSNYDQYIGINLDKEFMGIYKLKDFYNFIIELNFTKKISPIAIHIHHLLNYDLNLLQYIIQNLNLPVYFFIHDFYTICKSINLIDSNNNFCGFEFPNEKKCSTCNFFNDANKLSNDMRKFISLIDKSVINYIVPSEFVFDKWTKQFLNISNKTIVREHMIFSDAYPISNKENHKLKIAFIGGQYNIKGFNEWCYFVEELSRLSDNYEFYYFGNGERRLNNVKNIPVNNFNSKTNQMVRKS